MLNQHLPDDNTCAKSSHMFGALCRFSNRVINSEFCRTQLCINTAIVYMQRFYMFHSFTKFHRNYIAAAALFLAAKVAQRNQRETQILPLLMKDR